MPEPPSFPSTGAYGARLGDADFWAPYVHEVLDRHGLGAPALESGFVGTYPTFLAGDVVVKLFGYFGSWEVNHAVELAMQRVLRDHPEIPAPGLLADGTLYADPPDPWPYLVTERLAGRAWRDVRHPPDVEPNLAFRLGEIVRRIHDIPVPTGAPFESDWLHENRSGCVERQRARESLPVHLVEQIPGYVSTPSSERRLIHADLTADHIFVEDGRLVGIIDWGDAFVTDPHYELAALHVDAFRCDRALLQAFVSGYDWPVDAGFPQRALSAALMHQFDLFAVVKDTLPLDEIATLDELATALWNVG